MVKSSTPLKIEYWRAWVGQQIRQSPWCVRMHILLSKLLISSHACFLWASINTISIKYQYYDFSQKISTRVISSFGRFGFRFYLFIIHIQISRFIFITFFSLFATLSEKKIHHFFCHFYFFSMEYVEDETTSQNTSPPPRNNAQPTARNSSNSITPKNYQLDMLDPFLRHPSDDHGLTIITPSLNNFNFHCWSRSVRIVLRSKNKLDFFDEILDHTLSSDRASMLGTVATQWSWYGSSTPLRMKSLKNFSWGTHQGISGSNFMIGIIKVMLFAYQISKRKFMP